eukprot:2750282-Amphidinium_carterae.1
MLLATCLARIKLPKVEAVKREASILLSFKKPDKEHCSAPAAAAALAAIAVTIWAAPCPQLQSLQRLCQLWHKVAAVLLGWFVICFSSFVL